MNFGFDEEQASLGDTVARLLADNAALLAPETTVSEQAAALRALADLGLFALLVPERFGGADLSLVDVALSVEALGAGLAPPLAATTLAAADVLVRSGSEPLCADLLPGIASGGTKATIAALEAGRGYDPADLATKFEGGRLSGTKMLVPQAEEADVLLVTAQGGGDVVLIAVAADAPGITLRRHEDLDPSSAFCEVSFADVEIDDSAIIGGRGAVDRLCDVAATMHAAMQVGIAARMMDMAVEYAKTRMQFGQPIGAFQAIKHRCADMAVQVEGARSASYYAWWAVAEDAPDRARAVSMAKAYCGEASRDVCNETLQIHGGMGFTWDLGLHRFMRRARVMEHAFGDGAYHNERIVAATMADLLRGAAGSDDAIPAVALASGG